MPFVGDSWGVVLLIWSSLVDAHGDGLLCTNGDTELESECRCFSAKGAFSLSDGMFSGAVVGCGEELDKL